MIETDYIVTCGHCLPNGDGPTVLHSLKEFGPIPIGYLWKRLHKAGWARMEGKEACPACIRRLWQRKPPTIRKKKV